MNLTTSFLLLSTVLAFLYLAGWPPRTQVPARMLVKAGSVLLLAAVAFLNGGPWLLVLALAFGSLGDAFLVHDGKASFIGGLASFLVAHLLYAGLFWTAAGGLAAGMSDKGALVPASACLFAAAGVLLRLIWSGAAGLRLPVVLYAAAIIAMTISALTTGRPAVIAGSLLFFASDAVLALEKFRLQKDAPVRRLSAPFVWASYYLAQLLILLGWLLEG